MVTAIRQTNPTRILMMSPRVRSDAQYLSELKVPTQANGYMMAEWHFYASGPSKENESFKVSKYTGEDFFENLEYTPYNNLKQTASEPWIVERL